MHVNTQPNQTHNIIPVAATATAVDNTIRIWRADALAPPPPPPALAALTAGANEPEPPPPAEAAAAAAAAGPGGREAAPPGHEGYQVLALAVSPDGKYVLTGAGARQAAAAAATAGGEVPLALRKQPER